MSEPVLTSEELTDIRGEAEATLPDQATIRRKTTAPDSSGGRTVSWADDPAPVSCRLSPAALPAEELIARGIVGTSAWILLLPVAVDLSAPDRVVVGGREFDVVGVQAPRSWEVLRRVLLTRRDGQ